MSIKELTTEEKPINADESAQILATMTDAGGGALTEGAIQSLKVTVKDVVTGAIINLRDAQSIKDENGGVVAPDASFVFSMLGADNPLVGSITPEFHYVKFEWTWFDAVPTLQDGSEEYLVRVIDGVDTVVEEPLDLSGMRRVKTKHMEIESHDPTKVQFARDKEKATLPTFCSSHFCKGVRT